MDLSNPKTWQGGISIMMEVPHIVVPLVILLMGGVWWLRGTIERSVKDGLKAQVGALSERLQLAHDQQGAVTSKLDTAKVETAALQRKVSQFLSEPAVVEATANVVGAIQMADSANAALSYILRADYETYVKEWQDHAKTASLIEKIAFTVEYQDGRTARLYVSQWDVRSGDDVVRIIATERQREGSLPKGRIKSFKRESDG